MNRKVTRILIASALAATLAVSAIGLTSARSRPAQGVIGIDVWEHAALGDAAGNYHVDGADFVRWQRAPRTR